MLLLSVAMAGCSDDDDTTSSFFELSSTDLECNSNNVIDVVVPIEGQTYKLTVKSSVDVIWTTKLEGGSWIVATPVTKQSGDGEILIVASSNPTNIKNRVATVTIRNSVNDEINRYALHSLMIRIKWRKKKNYMLTFIIMRTDITKKNLFILLL